MKYNLKLILLILITCFFFCIKNNCFADKKSTIFIIKSRNQKPHEFVSKKITELLRSNKISFKSKVFEMDGDFNKAKEAIKVIQKETPDLIISIGSEATLFLSLYIKDLPIIFSMVYKSDEATKILEERTNIKGVFINFDMDIVFNVLKDIKPELKRIGVMFPSKHFNDSMNYLIESAGRNDIEIISKEVNNESDVPSAIKELTKEVDAVYILPSPIFTSKQMLKRIVLKTLSNNIFVSGGSYNIVERGGLVGFGFDINYAATATAEMVKDILINKDIIKLKNKRCKKFRLYLNKRTARSINLKFPLKIEKVAEKIIE
ncbi:MAG: hypothetical protein KAI43_03995 [Candidatus Aureabacteria bacterium]|nr:hypothetical protein [Candidatus Auribacterota bacterium]